MVTLREIDSWSPGISEAKRFVVFGISGIGAGLNSIWYKCEIQGNVLIKVERVHAAHALQAIPCSII